MVMGELKGQIKELIHSVNNQSQKLDSLTERVLLHSETPAKLTALEIRVTALETERNRRDGATGIVAAILKSPSFGWLVGGAGTVWALVTGRIHL